MFFVTILVFITFFLHIQLRDDDDGDEGMGQGGRRGEGFRESVAVSPWVFPHVPVYIRFRLFAFC